MINFAEVQISDDNQHWLHDPAYASGKCSVVVLKPHSHPCPGNWQGQRDIFNIFRAKEIVIALPRAL